MLWNFSRLELRMEDSERKLWRFMALYPLGLLGFVLLVRRLLGH